MPKSLKVTTKTGTYTAKLKAGTTPAQAEATAKNMLRDGQTVGVSVKY
jgi:hypothetical protein